MLNKSDYVLSVYEEDILRYGLNHHITPKLFTSIDIKANIENKLHFIVKDKNITNPQFLLPNEFKSDINHSLTSFKNSSAFISNNTVNKHIHKTLLNLRNNKSIKVCSFDKDNGIVLLNSVDYYSKLDSIISDTSKFNSIDIDVNKVHPIISNENKLARYIRQNVKPYIDQSTYNRIVPNGSQPGKLYGLAKVHKPNCPLRPVVSMINTAEYNLAKYLDTFIKPNLPNTYLLSSTSQFVNIINDFKFNHDDNLISFDVESLFTNVPVVETIDIISEYVYSASSKSVPPFSPDVFKRLLVLATSGIFMYNNKFYRQIDGVTMGSPLGPSFANFFLAHLEKNWLDHALKPSLYLRYVDDIFCVFNSSTDFNTFFNMLNATHPNLKFTYEVDNKCLPFLDTTVTLPEINSTNCTVNVYRKKTDTNLILNFHAFCPFTWKRSLIFCFLHRAFLICSDWFILHKEILHLENIFIRNGFPKWLFYSCVKRFLHNKFNKENLVKPIFNCNNIICIPYFGRPSLIFRKHLIKLFKNHLQVDINVVFQTFKIKNYFSLKCNTPLSLKANVIYKFNCLCDTNLFYIGKTKRHLVARVKEHKSNRSQIGMHLSNCTVCNHSFNCNSFKVLGSSRNDFEVQIKEALYIKLLNPPLNRNVLNNGTSFFLKVF